MVSIVETISSFLATTGLGLTEATNLFCYDWGIMGGDNSVLLMEASGPPPLRFIGDASTLKESHITILIRNTTFSAGLTLAQNIYDALDNVIIAGIVTCFCEQGEPIFVEKEETNTGSGKYRYYFSINISVRYVS